ncbi:MAG: hypothetical protein HPY85_08600 [Anaerolineae bacterium]|nr:hypothetical protein [Anaerolineae bacterium]
MKQKLFLLLIILSLLLSACSASSKIVGSWVDADGVVYEFFKDGTVTIDSWGITISGTYEFIDKDTLKMNLDGLWGIGGATVFDVEFSGKQLLLTSTGQTVTLEKAE